MALAGLGRLDDAAALARSGLTAAVEAGNRAAEAFFGSTLGWVQLNQGLLVSAQRTYRESAAAFRASSYSGPLRWALGGLLFAAALARDMEVAHEAGPRPRRARPSPGRPVRHGDQPGTRLGGRGRRRSRAGPSPAP